MNIFKDAKEMLGEVNVKELGVTFVEFIELARLIRNKLEIGRASCRERV